MRVLLVYNPQAGHGRSRALLPAVLAAFREAGVEAVLRLTESPGHAEQIAAEASFGEFQGIVAAGGDGTLFEVVNGYYRNPSSSRIPLGIVPIGTGNAFARDLTLGTSQIREAVSFIAAGRTRRVDVGRFTTGGKQMHYLNILGLGFVADVVLSASRMKLLGNVSYTIGVLLRTISLRPYHFHMELDGRVVDGEGVFTEISNTRYTSNFLMAPAARIDDGLLDVTLLGRLTRRRLLAAFPLIFTGEHVKIPEVQTFTARHISVTTDTPKVLTPDGELLGTTPIEVECLPRDLEVFCR
ncbi:MAG: diacylglycerol kinase family protein [Spirochaetia bacterium]